MNPLSYFKKIHGNFTLKVLLGLWVVIFLLGSAFTTAFITDQQKSIRREAIRTGMMTAKILAKTTKTGIFAGDLQSVKQSVQAAFELSNVVGVCVLDENMEILTLQMREANNSHPHHTTFLNPTEYSVLIDQIIAQRDTAYHDFEEIIEFWSPVFIEAQEFSEDSLYFENGYNEPPGAESILGFVGVAIDKTPLSIAKHNIIIKSSLILLIFLLIGGLATYLIVREATGPLNKLIKEINPHDKSVVAGSDDQLDQLAGTFDSMIKELGSSFKIIAELKNGLQEKVGQLEEEVALRKIADLKRRESEETARALLNSPAYLAMLLDRQGIIIDINKAMAAYLENSIEALIGQNLWELYKDNEIFQKRRRQVEKVMTTGSPLHTQDQRQNHWFDIYCYPLLDMRGAVTRVAILARDITTEKEAEKQRYELELKALNQSKLASLGQIATGVAHEINQPLSFIKVSYESALRDIEAGKANRDELASDFKMALRQVDRITKLTNHLRTFGRRQGEFDPNKPVSLPTVLDNSLILMNQRLKRNNIKLIKDIAPGLPLVSGNDLKLEQVFINLFQNAIDELDVAGNGEICVAMSVEAGKMVVRFSDNGRGIPPQICERIFEPFFTTKDVNKGTGLGLAIVYGIINEHQGAITCEPEPNGGTRFVISMPVIKEN